MTVESIWRCWNWRWRCEEEGFLLGTGRSGHKRSMSMNLILEVKVNTTDIQKIQNTEWPWKLLPRVKPEQSGDTREGDQDSHTDADEVKWGTGAQMEVQAGRWHHADSLYTCIQPSTRSHTIHTGKRRCKNTGKNKCYGQSCDMSVATFSRWGGSLLRSSKDLVFNRSNGVGFSLGYRL